MSLNARRYTKRTRLIERDRTRALLEETELPKQTKSRIFVIVGDTWAAACHTFPSLVCVGDSIGPYQEATPGRYRTYGAGREVIAEGKNCWGINFGVEGSIKAATQVIAYMQQYNHQGEIEFLNGYIQNVMDYELPEWALHGSWHEHYCGPTSYCDQLKLEEDEVRKLFYNWFNEINEKYNEVKEALYKNYEPISDKYYLSNNPNDYLFYTDAMIMANMPHVFNDKDCEKKWEEIKSQVKLKSPYAFVFEKALEKLV